MSRLSVVLATYNENINFLKACIDSLLNQTFRNFELIIVTEPEEKNRDYLRNISAMDSRIKILENETKLGISSSRNRAIMESSGKYIAFIDGDDYCDLRRFEMQVKFLEDNPLISVVGSNILLVDENNNFVGERIYPEGYIDIKKRFLLSMPVANPTVILRRKDLEDIGLFDIKLSKAEDFELWLRFLANGKKMHNLQENLVYYRVQTKQSDRRGAVHWKNNYSVRKKYSKLIWPLHSRCMSLSILFIISHTPRFFSDYILNSKLVEKIKSMKLH